MLRPARKSRSAHKKTGHRTRPVLPKWHSLRMTAILSFLCMAVFAVVFAIAANAPVAFGQKPQATDTCAQSLVEIDAQPRPEKWFSIKSESAGDILSAVQCTSMFQSASQGDDLIAYALQNGTLAAPVLVKPYRSDVGLAQYWVVPVVDKSNLPLALLTFFYNPKSGLIHESEFSAVTNNMFYVTHSFPAIKADRAIAAVSTEQHVAAVQGRAPELIYFLGIMLDFWQVNTIGAEAAQPLSILSGVCLVGIANGTTLITMVALT